MMVAFSGGVDSGLLAAVAHQALGARMCAVTIQSPVETLDAVEAARSLAAQVGFAHRVIEYDDLANHAFTTNPPDRCYFCKQERLGELVNMARAEGFAAVAEGSNLDDEGDYRPGKRAVQELGVLSPLKACGFTKAEVRALAHELGLPSWNRPSAPCLATRFPFGTPVTKEGIDQIARGEAYLRGLGFEPVRVRHYGNLARLEVSPSAIAGLVAQKDEVAAFFKQIGFQFVTVDLMGYRSGSMNEGVIA
ncbi:MAG: ATP-dependent sacrificial sulfur transferase LarE [Anaerolineae bacterium]|nr:ATP-dependent sacrificial sulfur transferase LarE [Anaerolineae bacterium]